MRTRAQESRCIAIDFDGVIHAYSKGWQDGSCYDQPVPLVFETIKKLMDDGFAVYIFSTRKPRQIKHWIKEHAFDSDYIVNGPGNDPKDYSYPKFGFEVEIIPWWKKFWNEDHVLGISRRKLPAEVYVDDRAVVFEGDWIMTYSDIKNFRTYQNRRVTGESK